MKYLIIFLIVFIPIISVTQPFSPPDSISSVWTGIGYDQPLAWPNAKHITDVIMGSYYFPVVIWETGGLWGYQSLFSYWDDMFKYWSFPDSFTMSQGMNTGRGNVASDSHGNLHFAWQQTGNPDGSEIFYTTAFFDTSAGLIQFSVQRPPVMMSATDSEEDAFPALCLYNDSVYIVWNHGIIGEESAIFSNIAAAETAYAGPISGGFLLNSIAPDPLTGDLWVASTFDINLDSLIDIVALHYDKSSGTWSNEVAAYGVNSQDFVCAGITVNYNGVPGIVFLSSTISEYKNRFIVDPYGSLLFTRRISGNWTEPDTIKPTTTPELNGYIGWPSVGIAESNDIYIAFTQPVSLKQRNRYGIGPVYYTKIVPDSNIYNIERVLVSSDSAYCYHPHIIYYVPLPVTPPGPDICWCEDSGSRSIYFRHMPPLYVGVEEERDKFSNSSLKICPNPFTTTTHISLTLPSIVHSAEGIEQSAEGKGQRVKNIELKIYDLSGRLVKDFSLGTGHSLPGTAVSWDGRDNTGIRVKSGVYFVNLKVGEKVLTKKLILLE